MLIPRADRNLLARTLRPGEEFPGGIITAALIGAPFFVYLLRRQAAGVGCVISEW